MFGAKQITYQLMSCHPKGISCLQHLASTGGSIFIASLATVAIAAHVPYPYFISYFYLTSVTASEVVKLLTSYLVDYFLLERL